MARLSKEVYLRANGLKTTTWRVTFAWEANGDLIHVRLGSVTKKVADSVRRRIEGILEAKLAGTAIDPDTANWLGIIGEDLLGKLVKAGLAQPRAKAEVSTLGDFLENLFQGLGTQKARTRIGYDRARRLLEEFFTKARRLSTISEDDAAEYRQWMAKKFAPATVSVDLRRAKQYFKAAVRRKLIAENPFENLKCGSQANPSRLHFVTQETIETVIAACPNNDWRLIFALARYEGLRIPSELQGLKWSDVNWEKNRILVHVPKKEHIPGQATRIVPIFPELRPYLERAFNEAPEGAVLVVPRAKDGPNLRRYAEQIIEKAGVKQWPKLFQNCRASRETELMRVHPAHVVMAWIGHTERVARSHYLQVTDEDFDKAATYPARYPARPGASGRDQELSLLPSDSEKRGVFERRGVHEYPRQGSNLRPEL